MTSPKQPKFPMRINQYLAWKKEGTRRDGDKLVEKKQVLINGKVASHGDKVNETDKVEVLFKKPKSYLYYAYYKPAGEVTEEQPFKGQNIFPIGRLDKESEGLMILTNDGRITDKLLNPDYEHEKEYVVTVAEKLRGNFKEKMESGVNIEGYVTRKCDVTVLNDYTFKVTLTEGKRHQIRRMCVALFNQVTSLKRIRIMNIRIGSLAPGQHRALQGKELSEFMKILD